MEPKQPIPGPGAHGPSLSPPVPSPLPLSPQERRVVARVLDLYRDGWFPMCEDWEDSGGIPEVRWVQPNERGLIPLDSERFRASGTLRAAVRSGRFTITSDRAFDRVIQECASPAPGREQTWLDPQIIHAFKLLHRAGQAHSIEAWCEDGVDEGADAARKWRLVGGLYGLALGRIFCGESMFSRPEIGGRDASKVCLVHLVHHLRRRGFAVLDSQLTNEHLAQFGCHAVPREEYEELLRRHARQEATWGPFEPEVTRAELKARPEH